MCCAICIVLHCDVLRCVACCRLQACWHPSQPECLQGQLRRAGSRDRVRSQMRCHRSLDRCECLHYAEHHCSYQIACDKVLLQRSRELCYTTNTPVYYYKDHDDLLAESATSLKPASTLDCMFPTNKKVPLSAKSAVGYPDNQLSSLGWIIFLLHWDKPCNLG
jgi:hypothetical protein